MFRVIIFAKARPEMVDEKAIVSSSEFSLAKNTKEGKTQRQKRKIMEINL